MAHLDIAFLTGDVERHELSKQQPVSIGSHSSNDICVDEDGVEMIHCRIAWNKTGFEAVSAGVDGIDVNGSLVQRAMLSAGDVLRFGSVDITFQGEGTPVGDGTASEGEVGLKPITDEVPAAGKKALAAPPAEDSGSSKTSKKKEGSSTRRKRSAPPAEETIEADAVDNLFEDDDWEEVSGLDALAAESRVDTPARRALPGREGEVARSEDFEEPKPAADVEEPEPKPKDSLNERFRQSIRSQKHRPGEEDTLRSPLVLGLGGGAAVLVLVGFTFYFIAGRQTTQTQFEAAKQLFDEGKFAPAIEEFENFLVDHPRGSFSDQARLLMDQARIDQNIKGAVPKWPEGLEALRGFVGEHRDDDDFNDYVAGVWERAGAIALGSATRAGKSFDRSLLDVSDQAETILNTYIPKDSPPEQLLKDIDQMQRASAAAILRHETFTDALAALDEQLKQKQTMQALVTWRDLLVRYPDLAHDKELTSRLQKTLETERGLVQVEEVDRPGLTEERDSTGAKTISLIFRARSRTDQVSVGQAVPALAQDCCYGVDTVTGAIHWRRVIGLDTPFFPLKEPTLPSVILFDTNHQELLRLDQNSGALVWRQPIDEPAAGHPLLVEGQIYLPTASGSLYRIELDTGALSTRLRFPQAITGPALTDDGLRMVVVGDREVAYTLGRRPLECQSVSFLGQKPASVQAALLTMGPYVLMAENSEASRGRLRLIDTRNPETLTEAASSDVAGLVLDTPVIRGKDLFVPSTSERVSAFTVSDEPGEAPLVAGPSFQVKGDQRSPIYLSAGPDRQLWMASSALRKLQLTSDALEADQNVVATGIASQPLQYTGGSLFNARRLPFADAVTLTQTDRDTLDSEWRVVLGARLIACSTYAGDSTIVCATEAGGLFRLSQDAWQKGGVADEAELLPLSPELKDPLLATPLADGQIAIAAGDPEPRVWVITRRAQIDRSYNLDSTLQLAPIPFGDRLLLAMPGRIQIARGTAQLPVQDFALASDEARATVWRQILVVDENDLIAVTDTGQLIRVQYQTSPRSHLGEVSRIQLPAAVDFRGDLADGMLAIADSGNSVHLFDAASLDPVDEVQLPDTISNDVWLVGGRLYVETGQNELRCLKTEKGLKDVWPQPLALGGAGLSGPPVLQGSRLVVAERNGHVSAIDVETGDVTGTMDTGAPVSGGIVTLSGELLLPLLDGSLIHVTGVLAEASK